jgi:hypothetical protein
LRANVAFFFDAYIERAAGGEKNHYIHTIYADKKETK